MSVAGSPLLRRLRDLGLAHPTDTSHPMRTGEHNLIAGDPTRPHRRPAPVGGRARTAGGRRIRPGAVGGRSRRGAGGIPKGRGRGRTPSAGSAAPPRVAAPLDPTRSGPVRPAATPHPTARATTPLSQRRPWPTRQHTDHRGLVERPTSHLGARRARIMFSPFEPVTTCTRPPPTTKNAVSPTFHPSAWSRSSASAMSSPWSALA